MFTFTVCLLTTDQEIREKNHNTRLLGIFKYIALSISFA